MPRTPGPRTRSATSSAGRRDGSNPAATSFRWSIFVQAGDRANANAAKRGNIRGDTFGSPDGIWADDRGVLWIQTDISTSTLGTGDYVNIPTNMMLAADPATGDIRRFLTGPRGCEVTGIDRHSRPAHHVRQHPAPGRAVERRLEPQQPPGPSAPGRMVPAWPARARPPWSSARTTGA